MPVGLAHPPPRFQAYGLRCATQIHYFRVIHSECAALGSARNASAAFVHESAQSFHNERLGLSFQVYSESEVSADTKAVYATEADTT
ncbi:hypothetical protein FRX31_026325 [Thalictrum thalictroides]|uniref:Uncharacterized protein n=1 Tax=Thalictrum thalictroides TaxID=46969 RepID=A0A7J6VHM2_THATH|nr:hypothetical protein FRX31_026325 [Thalictrum thalictroides]